jgi:Cof subfamily protein (haloacid dehalogenase superfamily)
MAAAMTTTQLSWRRSLTIRAVAVRIEAVVADLDGTLVARDSSVSRATFDSLGEIRAAGIPFVIATGRAPVHLREFPALTRYAEITVCCSGAIGCEGSRRLWQSYLARSAVSQVVATAGRFGAGIAGFDGTDWHATETYRKLNPGIADRRHSAVTASTLSGLRCVAMAIIHADDVLAEITRELPVQTRTGLSHVADRPVVDITSSRVDKGTGVLRALNKLGADPAAVVSFGDMPNDIPMFAVTGRAYAIGAAHPAVAAAARETLDPVEQDGFARKVLDFAASDWRMS